MAFKNFIKQGTYSVVDNIILNKNTKNLVFDVVCYNNENKDFILLKNQLQFTFDKTIEKIKGLKVNSKQDILNSKEFGFFFVQDEKEIYEKKEFIYYTVKDSKQIEQKEERVDLYYNKETYVQFNDEIYIKKQDEYMLTKAEDAVDVWNELGFTNDNIYKVVYEFCKKLEIFEGVEDC